MCGIFGVIGDHDHSDLRSIIDHSKQRGQDSSGLLWINYDSAVTVKRSDRSIDLLLRDFGLDLKRRNFILGHSRLITNGLGDNQPVVLHDTIVIHNGIVVNDDELFAKFDISRKLGIDTEIIAALANLYIEKNGSDTTGLGSFILSECKGVVSCAIFLPKLGELHLMSNNGSLYTGVKGEALYFASERYGLTRIGCDEVTQVSAAKCVLLNLTEKLDSFGYNGTVLVSDDNRHGRSFLQEVVTVVGSESRLLLYNFDTGLKRCSKCVLPSTMPFITFDDDGVCNYCLNYRTRNNPKPKELLFSLVEPYRRPGLALDTIVPFSGGRDSSYGLHLIVNELKLKPVAYTYDWGMVTDLGRRNISRMCSSLGVENIIIAADIEKKRRNIKMNLEAWLKAPHLGLIALLTAGDKHFFRHLETVKKQTGINLNLWGVNPMEVTHFKTGFLGIPPDFVEDKVYSNGAMKQLRYHYKRFQAMSTNLDYFNSSLFDTLSGEYHRSFTKKSDYFHIFDYWRWDEMEVNNTLLNDYDWELAIDTPSTWRIGDATAAFYNYVYQTVAGFTEHDTFRSNQIREGQITRDQALKLLENENAPRYNNLKWYLETLEINFTDAITVINNMPRLY
jgi:glucosamine--fructose-6-phosphate aminotransferase (isomerizing)